MIKYTILYRNGKTWNGKCNLLRDIRTHKLEPRCGYDIPVWVSIDNKTLSDGDIIRFVLDVGDNGDNYTRYSTYRILGGGRFMMLIDMVDTSVKPTRKPNPASVTKKQKKFDEDYARWVRDWHLRGSSDITIQAYKKWLWEQKQAELKSVDVATSITFSEPVELPVNITISWDGIYKPWKEAAIKKLHKQAGEVDEGALPITLKLSYDTPIKTTYTFWLGAFGEIGDE